MTTEITIEEIKELERRAQDSFETGFNAGRKQGMKDAAEIISNSSAYWSVSRIKRAIPEAMEKLP